MCPVGRSARTFAARCSSLHHVPARRLNALASSGFTRHPIAPEHLSTGAMRTELRIKGIEVGSRRRTESMTAIGTIRRFSKSRRRVSRAHVGAYSGQVRAEQRRTSSGIGRPHLQRWKKRLRGGAGASLCRVTPTRPRCARHPFNDPLEICRQFGDIRPAGFAAFGGLVGILGEHGFESRMPTLEVRRWTSLRVELLRSDVQRRSRAANRRRRRAGRSARRCLLRRVLPPKCVPLDLRAGEHPHRLPPELSAS